MEIPKHALAALAFLSLCSCVSGSVNDTVSANEQVNLPSIQTLSSQVGIPIPNLGGSVSVPVQNFPVDVSAALSKLGNFGSLNLTFDQNTISDDNLTSLQEVKVWLAPSDNSAPQVVVSDYMVSQSDANSTSIEMPVENVDAALQYLTNGGCILTVGLTVDPSKLPTNGAVLQYDVELGASVNVSKGL